jgi:hypothetical protein
MAQASFKEVQALASEKNLTSDEHFTLDCTLIEARAGHKSLSSAKAGFRRRHAVRRKGPDDPATGSGEDFHGETGTNATHQSMADPEAKLYRKGPGEEAKLCCMGHVLMENRNGLVVDARLIQARGKAEHEAAHEMVRAAKRRRRGRLTVGGDKGFDTQCFVAVLRDMGDPAHVAENDRSCSSAIDGRTTRHKGYQLSQWKRKLIEKVSGWMKTVGPLRKTRHQGAPRVGWMPIFCLAM